MKFKLLYTYSSIAKQLSQFILYILKNEYKIIKIFKIVLNNFYLKLKLIISVDDISYVIKEFSFSRIRLFTGTEAKTLYPAWLELEGPTLSSKCRDKKFKTLT